MSGPANAAAHQADGRIGAIVFAQFTDTSTSILRVDQFGGHRTGLADFGYDPHWSPDGRLIAVSGCRTADQSTCVTSLIRPNGAIFRELPLPAIFAGTDTAFGPSVWSPDGRRLAGGADSSDASLNGLYTFRSRDGSDLKRLTNNPGGEDIPGSYSPDGRHIIFVRNVPDGQGNLEATGLFVINTDGSGLRQISPTGMIVNPEHGGKFSPDGTRILFDARPDQNSRFTLWVMRSNGTHAERLPLPLGCGGQLDDPSAFGCFAPSWSPDGSRIVFATVDPSTGDRNLYTVNAKGRDLSQVTVGDKNDDVPDWG
jgi:Tol biopolymer transport system component